MDRAPENVLVQQWVTSEQGDPFGRRVLTDGTVEECSGTTAELVGDEWRFGSRPVEWRQVARLEDDAVEALREKVRTSGVLDLPPAIEPPGMSVVKAEQVWTVSVGDRRHEIAVPGAGLQDVPALAELDEALQIAIALAGPR